MIRNLIPWSQLTRGGIPPMKIARRDLVMGEVTVPVGAVLDPELLPPDIRRIRLRQFYEQRLLEPVNAPENTRQFFVEKAMREQGMEIPVAPVEPVASRLVADLPAVEAPDLDAKRKKGAK